MTVSCGSPSATVDVVAPRAAVKPHEITAHGDVRVDDYYWLRERENPEVIAYLEAENEYTEAVMASTASLRDELYQEMRGRIDEDDTSVPYLFNGYTYWTRYTEGSEYPVHLRRRAVDGAEEEVLLDVNVVAEGHPFTSVRSRQVSPDNRWMAWAVDHQGRRKYDLRFRNLETGEDLDEVLEEVTGNVAWAADSRTIFFAKQDPDTLRSAEIYRYVVGSGQEPELVFFEEDTEFSVFVSPSKSREYLFIISSQTMRTEYRVLRADDPKGTFEVFLPRRDDHEYFLDHYGDRFFVRSNRDGKNYGLFSTPTRDWSESGWATVVETRDDVLFDDFEILRNFLVLVERTEGRIDIRVQPWSGGDEFLVEFDEPAYDVYLTANFEFDTDDLRYVYSSPKTPATTYDLNLVSKERTQLKQVQVLGGFDPDDYVVERLQATARDGVAVPVSLVYRKGLEKDGSHPALLYAYGSYGSSTDAGFRSVELSLIDRGFVYAIAHIRGGQEKGYGWYEDGKLLRKKNTFTDFIDVGQFLVDHGYTQADRLYGRGGSAGGLLMGAVYNMRPDLFRGLLAGVPFVDVVTTMLDASIPLTTFEYDEWGDPNEKESYDYMLSYSPYDQVTEKDHTNLFVTTGLHDSQVQYWEPAKWVAKLRVMDQGDNRILLKTNMEAGHGGASGRFQRLEERAWEYAFVLDTLPDGVDASLPADR